MHSLRICLLSALVAFVPACGLVSAPLPPPAPSQPAAPLPPTSPPMSHGTPAAPPTEAQAPAAPSKSAAPAKPAASAAPSKSAAPAPPKAPPVAAAVAPAPIDLRSLEQKLRDSKAIGVMTKLALKNQVDDLVAQFRALHAGRQPPTLAQLRQPFELLLMKVLALVQDQDPGLARALHDSRDYIWGLLADRNKFLANT